MAVEGFVPNWWAKAGQDRSVPVRVLPTSRQVAAQGVAKKTQSKKDVCTPEDQPRCLTLHCLEPLLLYFARWVSTGATSQSLAHLCFLPQGGWMSFQSNCLCVFNANVQLPLLDMSNHCSFDILRRLRAPHTYSSGEYTANDRAPCAPVQVTPARTCV